jgi:uncharacterized membrane protein YphA (DoxX/SURF4 family)
MTTPQVHCNIDEKAFSWTIFLTRLLTGIVILYLSIGCLLFYRDFLANAAAWGIAPLVAIGFVVAELFLALLLLLGWCTRWAAGLAVLSTAIVGVMFFASNFNKVYVALLMLLMAALLPACLLGPGRISVDFARARRRVEKEFRG